MLLNSGVRPAGDPGFRQKTLSPTSDQQAFWYKPYISPPKNWNLWGDLIEHFVRHLEDRYGKGEVRQWYFEVWNEPNISFWAGVPKQATYFKLYDVSARAIKSVDMQLRVGGPATAQAAWVSPFIKHCVEDKVPVDFISTHPLPKEAEEQVIENLATLVPAHEVILVADQAETAAGGVVTPAVRERLSPHQIGVSDLLDAARLLGCYPENLVLLGLVPERLGLGISLSPAVAQPLHTLVQRVDDKARGWGFPVRRRARRDGDCQGGEAR